IDDTHHLALLEATIGWVPTFGCSSGYRSLPPCGGGSRWGVKTQSPLPPPQPSPTRGEGEDAARGLRRHRYALALSGRSLPPPKFWTAALRGNPSALDRSCLIFRLEC